jgi:hypothetical protein
VSSNLANLISMGIKAAGACLIGLPAWAQSNIEREFISQENAHWEVIGSWQACVEVSDISLDLEDSSYIHDTLTVLREVVLNAESVDSMLNTAEQDIGALGLGLVSSGRLIKKMLEAKSLSYSRSRSKMEQNLSAESSASFVIGDCAVLKTRLKQRGRGILF